MPKLDPDKQRAFAVEVVAKLRARGFESYWAGGCVRDKLLGRVPKDYDVASAARPDEIPAVFGKRRTLAVGAAFGVITVVGPQGAGQIDVATFRQDIGYSDGRRPDDVRFSSPREDALRRDFTINGMFYDPVDDRVIDFVGGQEDMNRRVVRAIGEPAERFGEDKLRMLRAVRFAATLDFALDETTAAAIRRMHSQISVVSAERIAAEMRGMLTGHGAARALSLLRETSLLQAVLPEVAAAADGCAASAETAGRDSALSWDRMLRLLEAIDRPTFPQALAVVLRCAGQPRLGDVVGARWRLANQETERAGWLLKNFEALTGAAGERWSRLQPLLAHPGAGELVEIVAAAAHLGFASPDDVDFCRRKLALPLDELNPPPLVTGDDLIALGIPPGKQFAILLRAAREAQLDGLVSSTDEALAFVRQRWQQNSADDRR